MVASNTPSKTLWTRFWEGVRNKNRHGLLLLIAAAVFGGVITRFVDRSVWWLPEVDAGVWELQIPSTFQSLTLRFKGNTDRGSLQCRAMASRNDALRWWRVGGEGTSPSLNCAQTNAANGQISITLTNASVTPSGQPVQQTQAFIVLYHEQDSDRWRPVMDEMLVSQIQWSPRMSGQEPLEASYCRTEESDASCRTAARILVRSEIRDEKGPEQLVAGIIRFSVERSLVAALLYAMVAVNGLLVAWLLRLLVHWIGSGEYLPNEDNAEDEASPFMVTDEAWHRIRRLFEWLEVTGPATGFLLTVIALMQAFRYDVFSRHDMGRFGAAIGTALAATVLGLLMRFLAFSCDRLTVHLARWKADSMGVKRRDRDTPKANGAGTGPAAPEPHGTAQGTHHASGAVTQALGTGGGGAAPDGARRS